MFAECAGASRRLGTFACLLVAVVVSGTSAADDVDSPPVESVRSLLALDRWSEALETAREGYRRSPSDPRAAEALAESLFRAGRLVELERVLPEWAARPDATARTLAQLGRLRSAQGRGDEAGKLLRRAVETAPDDRDVLYWAGDLSRDRGRTVELLTRYLALSEGDDPDRIEATRGSLRALAELGDRRVWVARESPDRLMVPLIHVWDPSSASGSSTLGYVVEVAAGPKGKPVRLLLDTGSHGLFLVARVARKRGFVSLTEKTLVGAGGDRRHETRRGLLSEVSLGGLTYGDALVTTTKDELDPTGRFHGLLGVSIFGGYRVALDFRRKQLELTRETSPFDGVAYWWVSGQLLVEVKVGDERGLFVLDTGASSTVVASVVAQRAQQESAGREVEIRAFGGRVSGARELRGVRVEFAGLDSHDAPLVSYDFSAQNRVGGIEVLGLIGLDLLAGRRIEFDTVHQRLRIVDVSGGGR